MRTLFATPVAPFVAIEGMDGAGKTTLIQALKRQMEGVPVIFTREPGGTLFSDAIRNILLNGHIFSSTSSRTQLLGFFCARSDHVETIRSFRMLKYPVITDRFDGSTFAYQAYGEPRDPEEQKKAERLFWALRDSVVNTEHAPTLYLYLDLPPDIARARRAADTSQKKNHYDLKQIDFYQRLQEGYRTFFSVVAHQSKVVFVDATLPRSKLFEDAFRIIHEHITRT